MQLKYNFIPMLVITTKLLFAVHSVKAPNTLEEYPRLSVRYLGGVKEPVSTHLDYCFVAEVVMTIPRSNASEERIFFTY